MRYVVVGASAAGLAAAEGIFEVDPGGEVLLLSEERQAPYCRPLISYWLAREAPASLFPLPSPALNRGELRAGVRAVHLDAGARRLTLAGGEVIPYDRLCLATGAAPKPLGLPGEEAPNVFSFRTRADAEAIEAELGRGAGRALVLGGGLVGVKAALSLAARGLETGLCVASGFPLSQSADETAGGLVTQALESRGVRVRLGCRPSALRVEGGRVTGIGFHSSDGVDPCDVVIRAKGVEPRGELLGAPPGGVAGDQELRTGTPGVWVAGDTALTHDLAWEEPRINAIWPAAVEQGRLAGRNMAGARESYPGSLAMNSLRVGDLHLVTAGITRPPLGPYRALQEADASRGAYRKLVLREGRLVGAVFAGEAEQAGLIVAAIRAGSRLEDLPFDPLDRRAHWGAYAFAGPFPPFAGRG
ncbi:MAG: FAD-dependent oxidoreductase [Deferrisomatales bacterium]|nr:FAD-dependent oxidoreductase [Deferrisomatales bacterium]